MVCSAVRLPKADPAQRFVQFMALSIIILFAGLSSASAYAFWVNRDRMTLEDILNRPMCGSGLTPNEAAYRQKQELL